MSPAVVWLLSIWLLSVWLLFIWHAWLRRPPRVVEVEVPVEVRVEVPVLVEPPPEPWRSLDLRVVQLPLEAIELFVDPDKLHEINRIEPEYLAGIHANVEQFGLREPLLMTVDPRFNACLHDGHHRVLVARARGERFLPVTFELSEGIRGYRRPMLGLRDWLVS